MKKTLSIIFTALILIMGVVTPTYAAVPEDNTVMPLWESISALSSNIVFNETEGIATGVCTRKNGVELLEGTMVVYKDVNGSWEYVGEASNSAEKGSLVVTARFAYESGVEYMSEFTVTAYESGVPETVTKTAYRTSP